jgi:hypothetical protein
MSMSLQTEIDIASQSSSLSDAEIQTMLAKAVRLFAERVAERDGALPAFASDAATATEVMVTVTAMMKAVNLQVFELGMWQAWSAK